MVFEFYEFVPASFLINRAMESPLNRAFFTSSYFES